ncbi:MAG: MFS transporter [Propionibacteriaceae bacterium]|nr:MFS transporter [Propionibacteriaceae bacterium]
MLQNAPTSLLAADGTTHINILSKSQAFWLAAMPGLAGGTLRLFWMFFPPIMGTRRMVSWSTIALILPMIGWGWVLMTTPENLHNSFGLLIFLALLTGIGGGIFSGYMPSTSYFFPKKRQGVALGLQAGLGNFGVSVVQLLAPILVGWGIFGTAVQVNAKKGSDGAYLKHLVYLQTPSFFIILLLVISAVLCFVFLKSVPIKANFRQQIDIFGNKHTWLMTLIYLLTFGCFSGLAGTMGLMLNNMVVHVPTIAWLGGTTIAFLGAFVGSLARVAWGPFCDKFGGGVWTVVAAIGIALSCVIVIIALNQTTMIPADQLAAGQVAKCAVPLGLFMTGMLLLFFFAGVGNASTFKQMPMIFQPRQAGGVIGWTAAIAAFGPFIFSASMNALTGAGTGAATGNFGHQIIPVFVTVLILGVVCAVIAWWFYARPKAEAKS